MKIPFIHSLASTLISRYVREERKYFHLPSDEDPSYMERYWVKRPTVETEGSEGRNEWAARIHVIKASDKDRHLHDHPWWNVSIILQGSYLEEVPVSQSQHPVYDQNYIMSYAAGDDLEGASTTFKLRKPGDVIFRGASTRHRLHLIDGPVYSLFFMGPVKQMWGFYTPDGKIPFREYLENPEKFL